MEGGAEFSGGCGRDPGPGAQSSWWEIALSRPRPSPAAWPLASHPAPGGGSPSVSGDPCVSSAVVGTLEQKRRYFVGFQRVNVSENEPCHQTDPMPELNQQFFIFFFISGPKVDGNLDRMDRKVFCRRGRFGVHVSPIKGPSLRFLSRSVEVQVWPDVHLDAPAERRQAG